MAIICGLDLCICISAAQGSVEPV